VLWSKAGKAAFGRVMKMRRVQRRKAWTWTEKGDGGVIRSVLLAASRSGWLERQFRTWRFTRRAVRGFMPGESLDEALAAARVERSRGAGVVLTLLGENVATREQALEVSRHYRNVLERFRAEGMTGSDGPAAEISVKLTHLGLDLGADVAREALASILASPGAEDDQVWIDMEASSYVDRTLAIYLEFLGPHPNLGICLQAYLRRTPEDLQRVLSAGGSVRLVKGAYREPATVAFPRKSQVDRAYVELGRLLRQRPPGAGRRHVLGTHDPKMIDAILTPDDAARRQGSPEVQMLYGIAGKLQQELLDRGVPFGVLISYGEQWFPWYMRRLAERPANLWFVLRSLARR
jgi:proline dehydrogenase